MEVTILAYIFGGITGFFLGFSVAAFLASNDFKKLAGSYDCNCPQHESPCIPSSTKPAPRVYQFIGPRKDGMGVKDQ